MPNLAMAQALSPTALAGSNQQQIAPVGLPNGLDQFRSVAQVKSQWCWAAVSSLVDAYVAPIRRRTQQQIATEVAVAACATSPGSIWCKLPLPDDVFTLSRALRIINKVVVESTISSGGLGNAINAMRQHLQAPNALCPIKIEWNSGTSHYIAAVATVGTNIIVYDPAETRGNDGHLIICSPSGLERFEARDNQQTLGKPIVAHFVG